VLLVIVCGLTFLCIIVPLLLTTKRLQKAQLRRAVPLLQFFAGIGMGFMLVEISQMQRLTVFLGHPTYGLSVVLFSLLLSGGIGSYLTNRVQTQVIRSTLVRLSILLLVLLLAGLLTPLIISAFAGMTTAIRILVAVILLFPLGLFMGMAFPLGMKIASEKASSFTPWLWGINGATSVCASVFAVAISLNWGISVSYWAGLVCYVLASVAVLWIGLRRVRGRQLVQV
jgi:predicted membrane-bound spermidine synthase